MLTENPGPMRPQAEYDGLTALGIEMKNAWNSPSRHSYLLIRVA